MLFSGSAKACPPPAPGWPKAAVEGPKRCAQLAAVGAEGVLHETGRKRGLAAKDLVVAVGQRRAHPADGVRREEFPPFQNAAVGQHGVEFAQRGCRADAAQRRQRGAARVGRVHRRDAVQPARPGEGPARERILHGQRLVKGVERAVLPGRSAPDTPRRPAPPVRRAGRSRCPGPADRRTARASIGPGSGPDAGGAGIPPSGIRTCAGGSRARVRAARPALARPARQPRRRDRRGLPAWPSPPVRPGGRGAARG